MNEQDYVANHLAARIRNWRRDRGLSLAEVEELTDIPLRTLNGIEQGRGFRYPKLLKLALDGLTGEVGIDAKAGRKGNGNRRELPAN